jgi:hypothetical protein
MTMVTAPEEYSDSIIDDDEFEVKYELIVTVNDEQVFSSEFLSEESLQESGLRKAAHAIRRFKQEEQERDQ